MATSRDFVQSIIGSAARLQNLPDEVLDWKPDTFAPPRTHPGTPGDIRQRLAEIDDQLDDLLTALDEPEEA